jgi:flagellar motor switch protein FliG
MDGNSQTMTATPPSNIDKAAVLLRRLPSQALAKVLEMVGKESSEKLRIAIDAISKRPDLSALDQQVLEEFREMQREVRESVRGSSLEGSKFRAPAGPADNANANGTNKESADKSDSGDNVTTEEVNVVDELKNTPPAVLATALQRETPRTMALVLKQLPMEATGKVLELLSTDLRQQIFMFLAMKSTVHPAVTQNVLNAVAKVCKTIDVNDVGQQDERFKTLVGILQMVEREERMRLMESLAEQDEELAAQIDDNLYDYSDVMRIQDRSVQKLLTQLELKVVATALKTAPADIVEKVMKNLSERVRATLNEEMELLNFVSPSKVEQARREIANVIRQQDKDGTLLWIE